MTIHIEYHENEGQAWACLSGDLPHGTISGEAAYVRRQVAMQVAYHLRQDMPHDQEEHHER